MSDQVTLSRRDTRLGAAILAAFAVTTAVHAQTNPQVPYTARAFTPAHGDLARSAGVPAQLANEEYVEALARVVYYWDYPAIDVMTRTSQWETMKQGPGAVLGVFPGGPVNTGGCLSDYMSPSQRMVVTPNNDTIYMSGFADLGREPAVIQTPTTVPNGHYWTIQIADVFTRCSSDRLGGQDTGWQVPTRRSGMERAETGRVYRRAPHADECGLGRRAQLRGAYGGGQGAGTCRARTDAYFSAKPEPAGAATSRLSGHGAECRVSAGINGGSNRG